MSFLSHPHCPTLQIHHTQKSAIPHQPSQKHTTIPRLAPSRLPPLSKGGGLTARHKLSLCCVLLAIHPPFLFTKLFAVKTEGLLHHPSLSTTSMPPLSKVRCCRPKKFGRLPEGLPHHYPSLAPTLPNPHYPTLSTTFLAPLPKGAGLRQGYFLL